jgi:hypothetical protein
METSYEVKYPKDMLRNTRLAPVSWAESTIHSLVESMEGYARAKPLSFAVWSFSIGFVLGWKLKFW